MDYFTLFNLPINYQIDLVALNHHYQALQRQHHPDRFAKANPQQQAQALQQTTLINDAYQTLKHPLRRAEYLLSLQEINVQNEQVTLSDSAFLMEQFALREQLSDIEQQLFQDQEAEKRLTTLSQQIQQQFEQRQQQLVEQLAQQEWLMAAENVQKLRFLDKLQQQIDKVTERLFDF